MSEWCEKSLGDLGRIVTGKTPSTSVSEFFGGDVPFVTPSDMDGRKVISRTERYLTQAGVAAVKSSFIPKGSVMVSCIGSDMGKATVAAHDSVTNQQINSIIVSEEFCADFVYYNLSARKAELQSMACSGSAQPILNKGHFSELPILLPSLAEQRAIASVLGALDDKIELNRRMNETLEALAQSLFKSWFVDATQEGLPKGWCEGTLGDLCEIAIGGDWGEDKPFDGSIETVCLRGVDLEHLRYGGHAEAPRRWVKTISLSQRRLDERDVLVAASGAGPTGRPLWAFFQLEQVFGLPVIYSNFCKRLRCQSPAAAVYVDRLLHIMRESGEIWEYVNGTSIPNLDAKSLLRSKEVLIPPTELLERFYEFYHPIAKRLYSGESRTLAALRDALLPKLLSGEIRVRNADKSARSMTDG